MHYFNTLPHLRRSIVPIMKFAMLLVVLLASTSYADQTTTYIKPDGTQWSNNCPNCGIAIYYSGDTSDKLCGDDWSWKKLGGILTNGVVALCVTFPDDWSVSSINPGFWGLDEGGGLFSCDPGTSIQIYDWLNAQWENIGDFQNQCCDCAHCSTDIHWLSAFVQMNDSYISPLNKVCFRYETISSRDTEIMWYSWKVNYVEVPTSFRLSVVNSGTGTGTVTSNPSGINCGSDCTNTYNSGTNVTLTATPATGSTFAGWSGGGCSGTGACTVTMSQANTVTATFNTVPAQSYALTVTKDGTGSGTVTSDPAGINCGSDCTNTYNSGTNVTLTATPATGSTFAGWSGGGCSGTGTCTVTMDQAKTVTATFTPSTFILSISKSGTGSGTVTSSPGGINCGSDCLQAYDYGTSVTLTATPATGSTFAGWSGGGVPGRAPARSP